MIRFVHGVGMLCLLGVGAGCRAPAPGSSGAVPAPTWSTVSADPTVAMDTVRVRSGNDEMTAYLARPNASGRYPAIIVLHANRLTEPYIASVTAMLGKAGFVALALDIFHFLPGNATWDAANRVSRDSVRMTMEQGFREPRLIRDVQAGIDYLRAQSFVAPGGVTMLGFCGGGWNSLLVAAQSNDVGAVVAFYAPVALSDSHHRSPMELTEFIRVPVQFHYATRDQFVPSADVDRFGELLRTQGTVFERHDYDAQHGFFAWNRQGVFSPEAAAAAWERVVGFLRVRAGQPTAPRPKAPPAPADGAGGEPNHLHLHG
jgi:carboxymethylenebutenolidase